MTGARSVKVVPFFKEGVQVVEVVLSFFETVPKNLSSPTRHEPATAPDNLYF